MPTIYLSGYQERWEASPEYRMEQYLEANPPKPPIETISPPKAEDVLGGLTLEEINELRISAGGGGITIATPIQTAIAKTTMKTTRAAAVVADTVQAGQNLVGGLQQGIAGIITAPAAIMGTIDKLKTPLLIGGVLVVGLVGLWVVRPYVGLAAKFKK